jgi:hypothetical protein
MLNGVTYYNAIVRKVIVAFGRLFSDIRIVRYDQEGNPLQTVAVPIAYAPKEKWTVRIEEDPSLNNTTYNVLPRLSFEILGYAYDASRSLNKMNPIYCNSADGTGRKQLLTPAPYNIEIALYALTKTTEDGLTILEQILPTFRPDYTLSIKAINDLNVVMDVPIVLNSVTVSDQYEGNFEDRRVIIHTFNFTLKVGIFGAASDVSLINTAIANVNNITGAPIEGYTASATTPVSSIVEAWKLFGDVIE